LTAGLSITYRGRRRKKALSMGTGIDIKTSVLLIRIRQKEIGGEVLLVEITSIGIILMGVPGLEGVSGTYFFKKHLTHETHHFFTLECFQNRNRPWILHEIPEERGCLANLLGGTKWSLPPQFFLPVGIHDRSEIFIGMLSDAFQDRAALLFRKQLLKNQVALGSIEFLLFLRKGINSFGHSE